MYFSSYDFKHLNVIMLQIAWNCHTVYKKVKCKYDANSNKCWLFLTYKKNFEYFEFV